MLKNKGSQISISSHQHLKQECLKQVASSLFVQGFKFQSTLTRMHIINWYNYETVVRELDKQGIAHSRYYCRANWCCPHCSKAHSEMECPSLKGEKKSPPSYFNCRAQQCSKNFRNRKPQNEISRPLPSTQPGIRYSSAASTNQFPALPQRQPPHS